MGTVETLTIAKRELSTLRKRDHITAIDGDPIDFVVTMPLHTIGDGTEAIAVRMPNGNTVNIYPDTNIDESVTVERTKRIATRKVGTLTFIANGEQYWESTDGRYVIEYAEVGLSECQNPHPLPNGGHCEGYVDHPYSKWVVSDVASNGSQFQEVGDTFKQVADDLADHLSA